MDDVLNDILRAADRHPNSRVSKLIRQIEEEPSQKNVVLLLIELSDHAEYATDFNISLRYYLDIFERLGIDRDLLLNEAGLLLVNSSKIYSKRVDYVQSLAERQILTLSNADNEIQQQKDENQKEPSGETTTPAEKPKRGRKRALDAPTDPYEVQLEPKKFKKMTQEKRFALLKTPTKTKPKFRNVEMEQQIHPAGWKYATIYDLENEEDVDTKRNYKLFTYHIEHRYNTLVSDINFRLHFKVKDYMDAKEEEMDDTDADANHSDHVWPSHSEEYVRKYISLENRVLQREIDPTIPYVSPKRYKKTPKIADLNDDANMDETITLEVPGENLKPSGVDETCLEQSAQILETTNAIETTLDLSIQDVDTTANNTSLGINDSGLGSSEFESSLEISSQLNITQQENTTVLDENSLINTIAAGAAEMDKLQISTQTQPENDSALGESILDITNNSNETTIELNITLDTEGNVVNSAINENSATETAANDGNAAETEGKVPTTLSEEKSSEDKVAAESIDSKKDVESAEGHHADVINENLENITSSNKALDAILNCADLTNSTEISEVKENTLETSENLESTASSNKAIDSILNDSDLTNLPEISNGKENTLETCESSEKCENSNTDKPSDAKTNQIISVESVITEEQNSNVPLFRENEGVQSIPNTEETSKNLSEDNLLAINNIFQVENEAVQSIYNTEETPKNLSEDNSVVINKADIFQVEIEVVNEDGKAESNTIQIEIPNTTDDEGVHLSDAYEDDFQLISPTLRIPDIMPGIERKDVTIYLDKELREALELRDNMLDHFSQETYKVPVIIEPKEQPLVFNILQLPPKLLKRKVLFKLGPDMDLYLKARMQKLTRPKEPRIPKQIKFFPLNNTDMRGILETPPDSPGKDADFLGFSDGDENSIDDADTTCSEFCGFTVDEQIKLLCHRLSRDSGVGVDVATLTPEKEPLEIIFEENAAASCASDLSKVLASADLPTTSEESAKENTEDLLNNLPTSIRSVLEAEIEEGVVAAVCDALSKVDENVPNEMGDKETLSESDNQNKVKLETMQKESQIVNEIEKETIEEYQISNEINQTLSEEHPKEPVALEKQQSDHETTNGNQSDVQSMVSTQKESPQTLNEKETETNTGHQIGNENNQTLPEEHRNEPAALEVQQSEDQSMATTQIADNNCSVIEDICKVSEDTTVIKESSENLTDFSATNAKTNSANDLAISNKKEEDLQSDLINDSQESGQTENTFFDLDTQGAKTKIQLWHEHLRPILAKSRDRHHFDVFQLGTEIIGKIQSEENINDNNGVASTFGDIMDNKDKSYVSRYFLSTLLLANQSNININVENKNSEMPSSWTDIQLKLISTKRHTVAIEDNIGMINHNKKRKNTDPTKEDVEAKKKKTKSTTKESIHDYEVEESSSSSSDDSEPLLNLQTIIKNTNMMTPTTKHRVMDSHQKTLNSEKSQEVLNTSQSILPPIDVSQMMLPSTSKTSVIQPNPENYEVNLNNIRILQPINKIATQGDDLDSGIFSVGEMSTS